MSVYVLPVDCPVSSSPQRRRGSTGRAGECEGWSRHRRTQNTEQCGHSLCDVMYNFLVLHVGTVHTQSTQESCRELSIATLFTAPADCPVCNLIFSEQCSEDSRVSLKYQHHSLISPDVFFPETGINFYHISNNEM